MQIFRRVLLVTSGILCFIFKISSAYALNLTPQWSLTVGENFPAVLIAQQTYQLPFILTNKNEVPLLIQKIIPVNAPQGLSLPLNNSCTSTTLNYLESCSFVVTYTPITDETLNFQIRIAAYNYVWKKTNNPIIISILSSEKTSTLETDTASILLSPSTTSTWVIKNKSSTIIAKNIKIILPDNLKNYITATSCDEINPQSTCTISLVSNNALPDGLSESISAQGDNTTPVSTDLISENTIYGLSLNSPLTFTEPGNSEIILQNTGNEPVDLMSISLENSIEGVTLNAIPDNCHVIEPNMSCSVPVSIVASAYGSGKVMINYDDLNHTMTKTLMGSIKVANTSIEINNNQDISSSIGTGSFIIKNIGNFVWKNPSVTQDDVDKNWLTIDSHCNQDLLPNQSCSVNYSVLNNYDGSSIITASGTNVPTSTINFLPTNLSMGIEGNDENQHLAYRAIRITNLTNTSQTLTNVTANIPATLANNVIMCDNTASNCDNDLHYASDCYIGKKINSGAYCHLWFKAKKSHVGTMISASATITAATQYANLSKSLNFNYKNDLYVGGEFNTAGISALPVDGIAKWDGNNWTSLDKDNNNNLFFFSLTSFDGDLYANGYYYDNSNTINSTIIKWNGQNWDTVFNDRASFIRTLLGTSNLLYVGGDFNNLDNVQGANDIASWDGSHWSALGSGIMGTEVWTLTSDGNNLYVGGQFNHAGGITTNNIAKWSAENGWSNIGNVNDAVYSLKFYDGILYAGGDFTTINNNNFSYVAQYDGSNWTSIGEGVNGEVNSLIVPNSNTIIAGGTFTKAAGINANSIAIWNNVNWNNIGDGIIRNSMNGTVNALEYTSNQTDLNGLYVGGYFDEVNGTPQANLGYYDGTQWIINPNFTVDNAVQSLLIMPSLTLTSLSDAH